MIKLEFSQQEVALIVASLRKQPMETVEPVVASIRNQINSLVKQQNEDAKKEASGTQSNN